MGLSVDNGQEEGRQNDCAHRLFKPRFLVEISGNLSMSQGEVLLEGLAPEAGFLVEISNFL